MIPPAGLSPQSQLQYGPKSPLQAAAPKVGLGAAEGEEPSLLGNLGAATLLWGQRIQIRCHHDEVVALERFLSVGGAGGIACTAAARGRAQNWE